jgi:hypothetical protein
LFYGFWEADPACIPLFPRVISGFALFLSNLLVTRRLWRVAEGLPEWRQLLWPGGPAEITYVAMGKRVALSFVLKEVAFLCVSFKRKEG